jgi:dTMP kinase
MALGMLLGPRALRLFSRRRLFGLAITGAGLALAVDSVLPTLGVAIVATLFVGALAGVAWVTGYTLLGAEVDDALRGRTWALVQSLVRLDLLAVLAVAPFVAGVIGKHEIGVARATVRFDGVTIILLGAGLVAAAVGTVAFRQMDDRRGVPLWRDLLASLRGRRYRPEPDYTGVMVAFEGGEGAGKTTQITLLAEWLRGQGLDVVLTHEPGATDVGRRLRQLLLDPASAISPRSEALLYAADRAAHVDGVILPALRRGAIVLTDRYVDSSIAYQGAGRALPTEEIAELSEWATGGLRPNLTVLLDIDPTEGLRRAGAAPDRIESESLDFHARVREAFRTLAARHPETYLVLDAAADPARVAARVRARVAALLPTLAGEATDEAGSGAAGGPPGTPEAGQSAADPATEILIPGER